MTGPGRVGASTQGRSEQSAAAARLRARALHATSLLFGSSAGDDDGRDHREGLDPGSEPHGHRDPAGMTHSLTDRPTDARAPVLDVRALGDEIECHNLTGGKGARYQRANL